MERHELRDLIDYVLEDRLPEGYVLDDGGGSMSWVVSADGATVLGIDIVAIGRGAEPAPANRRSTAEARECP